MTEGGGSAVTEQLERLLATFLECVSFESGSAPDYDGIRPLFIEGGLLIKNSGAAPEVSSVDEFIAPRAALVASGELTRFREEELFGRTAVFGNVAHRLSGYAKSGTQSGTDFAARGVILTQFVNTPEGWRMSSMTWDDERPGLSIDGLEQGRA